MVEEDGYSGCCLQMLCIHTTTCCFLLVGAWRILSLVYSSVFNNTQDIHGPAFDLYSYSPTLVSMLNILRFCCRKNSVETKGRHNNTKVKKKRVKNKDE